LDGRWSNVAVVNWQDEQRQRDRRRRAAVMGRPVPPVAHHASVPAAGSDRLESVSVGPGGEAVALWSSRQDAPALRSTTVQPDWATFPDPRTSRPVAVRVTMYQPEPVATVAVEDLTLAYPRVQPLPGGRVLVVGVRCRWRPDGPERNAVVYDADGQVVVERTLGDGIEHVMATADGHVWVGYFDEGVYGNFGWGGPGPTPLGAAGLVRFSPELEPDWSFPSHVDHPWAAIDDCYAVNVDGDTVWACYYSDFPLVRIHAGEVTLVAQPDRRRRQGADRGRRLGGSVRRLRSGTRPTGPRPARRR
jgi:hypothetical protein